MHHSMCAYEYLYLCMSVDVFDATLSGITCGCNPMEGEGIQDER